MAVIRLSQVEGRRDTEAEGGSSSAAGVWASFNRPRRALTRTRGICRTASAVESEWRTGGWINSVKELSCGEERRPGGRVSDKLSSSMSSTRDGRVGLTWPNSHAFSTRAWKHVSGTKAVISALRVQCGVNLGFDGGKQGVQPSLDVRSAKRGRTRFAQTERMRKGGDIHDLRGSMNVDGKNERRWARVGRGLLGVEGRWTRSDRRSPWEQQGMFALGDRRPGRTRVRMGVKVMNIGRSTQVIIGDRKGRKWLWTRPS